MPGGEGDRATGIRPEVKRKFHEDAALIFVGMLQLEGRVTWPRLLLWAGNASYSIYLVHLDLMYTVGTKLIRNLLHHGLHFNAEVAALILVAMSLVAGAACYRFIERPLLLWCQRTFGKGERLAARAPGQAVG